MLGIVNPYLADHIDWWSFAASQVIFGLVAGYTVVKLGHIERLKQIPLSDAPRASRRQAFILNITKAGRTRKSLAHESASHLAAVAACALPLMTGCDLPGTPQPGPEVPRPEAVISFDALYGENCAGCHGAKRRHGSAADLANPEYQALVDDAIVARHDCQRRERHADARVQHARPAAR